MNTITNIASTSTSSVAFQQTVIKSLADFLLTKFEERVKTGAIKKAILDNQSGIKVWRFSNNSLYENYPVDTLLWGVYDPKSRTYSPKDLVYSTTALDLVSNYINERSQVKINLVATISNCGFVVWAIWNIRQFYEVIKHSCKNKPSIYRKLPVSTECTISFEEIQYGDKYRQCNNIIPHIMSDNMCEKGDFSYCPTCRSSRMDMRVYVNSSPTPM